MEDPKCSALLKMLSWMPPSSPALGPILDRIRRPAEPCSWAASCPLALQIRPFLDHNPQPSLPHLPPASRAVKQSVISTDSSSLVFCALLIAVRILSVLLATRDSSCRAFSVDKAVVYIHISSSVLLSLAQRQREKEVGGEFSGCTLEMLFSLPLSMKVGEITSSYCGCLCWSRWFRGRFWSSEVPNNLSAF